LRPAGASAKSEEEEAGKTAPAAAAVEKTKSLRFIARGGSEVGLANQLILPQLRF
jgi:hypothetical protein